MKRLNIKSTKHGERNRDFNSQEELDEYLNNIGNHWGRQQEEIVIIKNEIQDEQGNILEPRITETLPVEVVFTVEDKTAEVEQEAINAEALAYLAATDWMIIRESEGGTPCPPEIKALRQAARLRIVR